MKRNFIFLSLLLIFVFALNPLMVLAQDGEDMEEFEEENGMFTLSYPTGWAVFADESGAVYIANGEETLEALQSEEDIAIESGQVGVALFFLPVDFLGLMGLDPELLAAEDTTPEDIVQAVVDLFMEMEGDEEEDAPVFGEPLTIELDEEASVAAIPFTVESQNLDGAFLFFEVAEGVYALGTVGAFTGEFADNEEALAAILLSIEFNMTSEELMELYMGGGEEGSGDEPTGTEEPGS